MILSTSGKIFVLDAVQNVGIMGCMPNHDELNELVGRLLADADAAAASHQAACALLLRLERLASAMTHQVELAKTQLTGLTPTGRVAPPPMGE